MRIPSTLFLALALALPAPALRAEEAAAAPVAEALPAISVVDVRARLMTDRVIASGLVAAVEEVQVAPLIEGQPLEELRADIGDMVTEGQVLAVLSRSTLELQRAEAVAALAAGWQAVNPAADLLVVGEMGIGNTTSAAAIAHALFGGTPGEWTGRGTGVDDVGLANKTRAVEAGVAANPARDPLQVLAALGGREVAAMAGAIARAHDLRIPVILDGFICCAAAAVLAEAAPGALDHCVAGHASAEAAHRALLNRLGKAPLLDLGLRLGEGSGAALAIGIVKGAIACHSGMASFAEAGVSAG